MKFSSGNRAEEASDATLISPPSVPLLPIMPDQPRARRTDGFPASVVSRRTLLALGAGSVAGCATLEEETPGHDPRTSAVGQVKIAATLDESPAYWAYEGTIYAVRPHLRPLPLVTLAGCQVQWAVQQPDAAFRMAAQTLTFFKDAQSGAFVDHFDNPLSGQRNEVRPNVFAGDARAVFPPDGSAMRITGAISASESAPGGFSAPATDSGIGRVSWSITRDSVVLATDQAFNVHVQPQLEAQTRTANAAAFFNPRVRRLPARYAATTISPWLGWMNLGDAEGHLVWHTFGDKLFTIDALPESYKVHAGVLIEQLVAKPRV